jgi:hypothetical protein
MVAAEEELDEAKIRARIEASAKKRKRGVL